MTLPAFAAVRRAAALLLLSPARTIDLYFLPAENSAANPSHGASAVERWDRQTDGRTDRQTDKDRQTLDRLIDPAAHTMRARRV